MQCVNDDGCGDTLRSSSCLWLVARRTWATNNGFTEMQGNATLLVFGGVRRTAKTTPFRFAPVSTVLAQRTTQLLGSFGEQTITILEQTVDFAVTTASFATSQGGTSIAKSDGTLRLTTRVANARFARESAHFAAIPVLTRRRVVVVLGTRSDDVAMDGRRRRGNEPSPVSEL